MAGLLLLPMCVVAGEYHSGAQLVCSDCHVMHASEGAQTWTPTQMLLKNSEGQVALCMSCHDGTDTDAPDIVASGTGSSPSNTVSTSYTSKYGSSAGFFQSDYPVDANPCAHSLEPNAGVTAPLSTTYTKAGGLVCSDCHDPHGNSNYRNLISDPNPSHTGSSDILINTQVKEFTAVNAVSPNPAAAYNTENIAFYAQSNVSAWCADCHDDLSENSSGTSPAHFRGHPSSVELDDTGAHTDFSNWQSGTQASNTGFGTDVGDSTSGIPRVRFGSVNGSNTTAGSGDTISCLSCHKAHGSSYKYGLVWPHFEGGADMQSGCQQCHFK